jgi:hypothetical protein
MAGNLKEKAQAYIDKAKDSALETRLAAENAQLKARLEALEAQVGRAAPAEQPAPTEPEPKAPAGNVFESWEDSALRAFIKERSGSAPKGNSSHATLVRQAQELFAAEKEVA